MIYLTRRHTLSAAAAIAVAGPLAWSTTRAATPQCDDHPTKETNEGPFFKPKSPERTSLLEAGMTGPKLILRGSVLSSACKPLAGALLDFWQADVEGGYDNSGFRLRGHQRTNASGQFQLETVMPGLYAGRTRHIHVKAVAPGGRILTTQLFFPDENNNTRDRMFRRELTMSLADFGGQKTGGFDFVLETP